jgi:hypothetical protein
MLLLAAAKIKNPVSARVLVGDRAHRISRAPSHLAP